MPCQLQWLYYCSRQEVGEEPTSKAQMLGSLLRWGGLKVRGSMPLHRPLGRYCRGGRWEGVCGGWRAQGHNCECGGVENADIMARVASNSLSLLDVGTPLPGPICVCMQDPIRQHDGLRGLQRGRLHDELRCAPSANLQVLLGNLRLFECALSLFSRACVTSHGPF